MSQPLDRDIRSAKEARRRMESRIQTFVQGAMETFRRETGLCPHEVEIALTEGAIDGYGRSWRVDSVKAKVEV